MAYYGQRGTLRDMGPDTQTIPRAELEAIRQAVCAIAESGNITEIMVYSDCQAVVDGFSGTHGQGA